MFLLTTLQSVLMNMEPATATDNCGEVTIAEEVVNTPGMCAGDYVLTRTITAIDDCGNSTIVTQVITLLIQQHLS